MLDTELDISQKPILKNKKFIFGIVIFIGVIGITLTLFSVYGVFRQPEILNPISNSTTPSTLGIIASKDCLLELGSGQGIITDSSAPIALSSRKILLESGLSEQYVNKQFSFMCGIEYSPSNHRVVWKYTIGEYEGILEGIINAPQNVAPRFSDIQNVAPRFSDIVGRLHDIQNVLPRITAEKQMEQCLGGKPSDININLVGGPIPFPNDINPEVNHDNKEGGLFMVAVVESKRFGDQTSYKYGYLNLETQKCTVQSRTAIVD